MRTKLTLTYKLAMAAGMDAGCRSMRRAGRKAWNLDDRNEACRTVHALIPLLPVEDRLRLTGNAEGRVPGATTPTSSHSSGTAPRWRYSPRKVSQ